MASRKHIPPAYEGCSVATPGLNRHDPLPVDSLPPELLENRLAVQASEIEQLAEDNHRLAASHVALRRDLTSAREEMHKLTEHIGSLRAEGDIQIRVLVDRITKMEVDIRAGESVKKDLQQAHIEARSLALSRKELISQIEQATWELEKARADVKRLPEMHAKLDSLRQEHQRLREIFDHEKGLNVEKVQRMQIMEKDMVTMDAKLEKLRSEVLEKRAHAPTPYCTSYISPPVFFPPAVCGNGEYVDQYPRPPPQTGATSMAQGTDLYNSVVIPPPPPPSAPPPRPPPPPGGYPI